jgi:hypothetical protein
MVEEKDKILPSSVVSALSQGNKLEAIKLLREAHGIGLKEAKDLVDQYEESGPGLGMGTAGSQQMSKRGVFNWIVLLAVALLACLWWFLRK